MAKKKLAKKKKAVMRKAPKKAARVTKTTPAKAPKTSSKTSAKASAKASGKSGGPLSPTVVWGSIRNMGDGSAAVTWFTSSEDAEWDQDNQSEGWGESCVTRVQTYVGSNVHEQAVKTSERLALARKKAKDCGEVDEEVADDWEYDYTYGDD